MTFSREIDEYSYGHRERGKFSLWLKLFCRSKTNKRKTHNIHSYRREKQRECGKEEEKEKNKQKRLQLVKMFGKVPLWWLPLLRSIQITTIAIIITTTAHITGTTRFIFDRMMRRVSSAVRSGISREGAIVPVTTTIYKERTKKPCFVLFNWIFHLFCWIWF